MTGPGRLKGARTALVILTLLNLFNYLDRYVLASLFESLKASELHLSDKQLGSLFTAFLVVYMLTSPLFGRLGDRASRPRLLAAGVAIWSLATALGGLARSFSGLFAARASVGIGEAAYGTIAPALLADSFPKERRGFVFAVFFAAIPIGSALGYVLGGYMDQHFGWRTAFFVAGGPGLLLALLCLLLRDPPRGSQDEPSKAAPLAQGARAAYARLFANPAYRLTVAGYAAYTFALGGVAAWTPAFLERVRGMPKSAATIQFGAIVVVTGFLGTFAGGWLGDRLLRRDRQAYLKLSGWTAIAAAPAAAIAFFAPGRALPMAGIVAAELLLFASTGPINSVIVNVVAPGDRATAVALSILSIHLLGDVPSPPVMGWISDATGNLRTAFVVVPAAVALAGVIWLLAARRPQTQVTAGG
ncbi:MAG: spinster family MFS transporter [Thermoanaerobaculia bacterium]